MNDKSPYLSVIVPVYNAERCIKRCIDSILSQKLADLELILIDDGSSDRSGALCRAAAEHDGRVRYIKIDNGGSYHARLLGAEQACGEYVMFCDADDYYLPNAFVKIAQRLSESASPLLQFGFVKKYNHLSARRSCTDSPIELDRDTFAENEYPRLVCSTWDASHLTTAVTDKAYHRSLIEHLPPSQSAERIFWGEDLIMNLHMLESCNGASFMPELLYTYTQGGGTKRFSESTMRDLDTIKRYQLAFFDRCKFSRRDEMERRIFSEVAGWLFCYVREATAVLDTEDVVRLIDESLALERFVLAREYFSSHPEESWEAAELLRRADADEYLRHAELYKKNRTLRQRLASLLRRIYGAI